MIFGPSILGHSQDVADTVFPIHSRAIMDVFSGFGIMFFFFEVGVKIDPYLMVCPGRMAAVIGASALIITTGLSIGLAVFLKTSVTMSTSLQNSLILVASSQSLTAFPVISTLLDELKIINTDVGRIALSSSMFSFLIGFSTTSILFSIKQANSHHIYSFLPPFLSVVAFVATNFLILRPKLKKMFTQAVGPKSIDEKTIASIFILVMVSAFISEVIGQHYIFGPLLLGLAVPDGPPLGAAISSKLASLGLAFFYPAYCAVTGLQTNVFDVDLETYYIIGIIIIFTFVVKLIAVILPALCFNLPIKEAVVLALILNARGIVELTFVNLWKDGKQIGNQSFTLVTVSVLVVTAIITPLVRMLYDPTKQCVSEKRSTIHHSNSNLEFRILVCIHNPENIPTIMNILEVTHASEMNPVAVTAMVLIELVGRSTPVLVRTDKHRGETPLLADQVLNSLIQYEARNEGCTTVQSYTSMSQFQTMHDDICRIAIDKRANVLILPFHKKWAISGKIESTSSPIQNLNINVLNKAPCSVGILIDRGILTGFTSVRTSQLKFHVAVLFLSGSDDLEALAYSFRMGKHERVHLTIIRLLVSGDENAKDFKFDNNVIHEYRQANKENDRITYEERVLTDGLCLSSYMSSNLEHYNLILVGKTHQDSPLLHGLGEWNECPELGVMGDMLASPYLKTKASVLVIQQHKLRGKLLGKNMRFLRSKSSSIYPELPTKIICQGAKTDSFYISVDGSRHSY
ncbi:cation/H(+) antiporter 15 isoform X2 [Gossypium hirsutum]|nr:cation/H(+) antiporter 15-like isoform X2 [Gossypium hirsutum]